MEWINSAVADIPRLSKFPLNVSTVYFCSNALFPSAGNSFFLIKTFEVSLRLNSKAEICEDIIDNRKISLPFPHVVFKYPGLRCSLAGDLPRDTISFSYNAENFSLLQAWGLIPDEICWQISLNGSLPELVEKFRHLCRSLTVNGVCDQLDWVCFQILQELRFSRQYDQTSSMDPESRIRKAAIYFQQHCNRSLSVEEVAKRFGFSRAGFFREWKRIYPGSPKEHILQSRLEMAALRLIRSNLSVAYIAEEVNFSGLSAFYRKFQEHFGVSPAEFRKNPELWRKVLPDVIPG